MSSWIDTVKETFKKGRLSNPSYQFKDALKDAKKYITKEKMKLKLLLKNLAKQQKKLQRSHEM